MEWKSRRSFCRYELCECAVIVSAGAELAGSIVAMLIAKANNTPTERIVKANRVMVSAPRSSEKNYLEPRTAMHRSCIPVPQVTNRERVRGNSVSIIVRIRNIKFCSRRDRDGTALVPLIVYSQALGALTSAGKPASISTSVAAL